jgi:hypothetical protein
MQNPSQTVIHTNPSPERSWMDVDSVLEQLMEAGVSVWLDAPAGCW